LGAIHSGLLKRFVLITIDAQTFGLWVRPCAIYAPCKWPKSVEELTRQFPFSERRFAISKIALRIAFNLATIETSKGHRIMAGPSKTYGAVVIGGDRAAKFPRDHAGESLPPFCYPLFEQLGIRRIKQ
jgi:hypothetical protein